MLVLVLVGFLIPSLSAPQSCTRDAALREHQSQRAVLQTRLAQANAKSNEAFRIIKEKKHEISQLQFTLLRSREERELRSYKAEKENVFMGDFPLDPEEGTDGMYRDLRNTIEEMQGKIRGKLSEDDSY